MKIGVMQYGMMRKILSIVPFRTQKPKPMPVAMTSKLYRTIHKLPLSVWKDCLVTQDLRQLIIEGNPTNLEIADCFETLYSQYVEAAGGNDAATQMRKTTRFKSRETRVKHFELLCAAINAEPSAMLYELFQRFPLYQPLELPYSTENIAKQIAAMKPYYNDDLIRYMNEVDAMKVENNEAPTHYTYEYFDRVLTEIESVFKMSIPESITVGKYCTWLNKYKAYVKAMESSKITSK